MDSINLDGLIKEVGEEEAIDIVADVMKMTTDQAALFVAIHLGRADGDVVNLDDDQRRKDKEPA
ncbi:MAG: hypothetical protein IPK63_15940 [Candidatus Competibacteraceae bacterium]|nr:hypothetical protein [Candidatus Competibacteraceae bacterium]